MNDTSTTHSSATYNRESELRHMIRDTQPPFVHVVRPYRLVHAL